MSNASQQRIELDSRLLEIEDYFKRKEVRQALAAMERLEREEFSPSGNDKGLFLLLSAQRAMSESNYLGTIDFCHQAMEILGTTSLNYRIGRTQYLLYRAYSALGDLKAADTAARDCLASYRRVKDKAGIVDAYNALGKVYFLWSDYAMAAEYVNEAILYSDDDPERKAQLFGNLGRIYLLTGEMAKAEENLKMALAIGKEIESPISMARNYLSLGYMYLRRRHLYQAEEQLNTASEIIRENDFRREHVIYLEYAGELSLEKQDFVAARKCLAEAMELAEELAPQSTLMSQVLRRYAEAEMQLGRHEDAMRLAQQALDLAQQLGEKSEIGLSHRVISQIFMVRNETADARRHGLEGIEVLREIGDNFELGRSIVIYGAIPPTGLTISDRKTYPLLQEAEKIFGLLGDDFHLGRCRFEMGRFCYWTGKNGEALEHLKDALINFRAVSDAEGIARVNAFLKSLSESAVMRALSDENEFKIFGNLLSDSEYKNLKAGPMARLLDVLVEKTNADRALVINLTQGEIPEISALTGIEEIAHETIINNFNELISDGIIADKPILILDCANETDFSSLIPNEDAAPSSLIILPLTLGSEVVGYIYLDRLGRTKANGINPFSQKEIDFAVGFADLAAFKTADYQKEKLIEDNVRLKAQLLEKCVFPNIITQSRPFMETLARVRQVSNSNMAIHITGDTGTGKDLLAKAIHYNSNRRDRRFISVNCAALPESLLESELFGYKKGAFTGADRDKQGLFEEADGGTFFLDEIADMPLAIQAKLLRVLENQELTRLGDTKPRKVDVRVISATNKDLKLEMEDKHFRSDLYYRLCALQFTIPRLADRREDIPLLVEHFLEDSNCEISPDAMKYLIDYEWPGNVRELENEIKKLVLLANNEGIITPALLSGRIIGEDRDAMNGDRLEEEGFFDRDNFSLYDYLAEFEKRFIIRALREQRGIKKRAADSLNIPESTLRLKLKQYDIDPKRLDIN